MEDTATTPIAKASDIEKNPAGVFKRWVAELDAASANENDWRKEADEVIGIYRSKKRVANSFNILWSNTETLRPAVYNSTPRPDVRRRFKDPDPVGKIASAVLERSLAYAIDVYDFDHAICQTVLDVLLPGRGVARVKYEPKFRPIKPAEGEADPFADAENPGEEVYDEYAECEHVSWKNFRHGPGESWEQVPWVAFRHCMPYDQLVEMFGKDMADEIPLDSTERPTDKKYDDEVKSLLKTAEVWEIWDKAKMRVLFIAPAMKKHMPVKVEDDPLRLKRFFPCPRPIYAIEDADCLVPQVLYTKYREQAEELNTITQRINRIVKALRVRGVYASNLSELKSVIESGDNVMQPIANASEIANLGGLDKSVWMVPIDKLQTVLHELFNARAACLQTIYEITGLGDVMRGVSNPHETLGAQEIKSQWGSLRLQKLQREVQRFIRDVLRLKAEIIAEHFSPTTLEAMTGIKLPTDEDKMAAQQALQAAQQPQPPQAPPQPGQPAPPAPPQPDPAVQEQANAVLKLPTWNDVMGLLQSEQMRCYRIDIETDSTIKEVTGTDQQDMLAAIQSVTSLFDILGPIVEKGVMSIEVAKQLCLSVARNARMGQAVEDAVEAMVQPPPPTPEQDNSEKVAAIKADSDQKIAAAQQQADQATHAAQLAADQQVTAVKEQSKQILESMKAQNKQDLAALQAQSAEQIAQMQEAMRMQRDDLAQQAESGRLEMKTIFEGAVKILVAEIAAKGKADAVQAKAEETFVKAEA